MAAGVRAPEVAVIIVCVSAFMTVLPRPVQSGVQMRVQFMYYNDPNGWDANGNPCDPANGPCDPLFTITISTPDGGSVQFVTDRASDQNTVNFGSKIVNIDNPVVLNRDKYDGSFTLTVRVDDYDPVGPWDYIGTFYYTYSGTAGPNADFRNVKPVTLRDDTRAGSTLSVQISVGCTANYYSSDCTKLCTPANDDTARHYNCDSSGNIACLNSFDPTSSCRRTYCANRDPCKNGGACSNLDSGFACSCSGLWGGPTCEEKLSACESLTTPCRNNGSCKPGTGSSGCVCAPGFNGTLCEADINECAEAVCKHSSACRNQFGTYSCQCTEGWTGKNCDQDLNECAAGSACFNGATCENAPPGNFTCHCQSGYHGQRCELDIDECTASPCRPEIEVCRNLQGSYICLCAAGYTGINCTNNYLTEAQVAADEKNRLLIGLLVPAVLLLLGAAGAYFGYRFFIRRRQLTKHREAARLELPSHTSAISTENASYAYSVGGFAMHSEGESPYEDPEGHYTKVKSLQRMGLQHGDEGDEYANCAEHQSPPTFAPPPLPPKRIVEPAKTVSPAVDSDGDVKANVASAPDQLVMTSALNEFDDPGYGDGYAGIVRHQSDI